ncbi:hypothetical protein FHX81_1227 [Saccharothrix saharensis]|uniref:Uncharacterized protein n=1 Tax=Saccharothrix saharensis TaxID=571190 RepID=A0A543J800_9PSEU|nr:hypothetical protein [Saccharothrix saharensis]TQM78938.1 hypothetical protein FHX81_1227 [Saccharothrix saharensis]
MDGTPRVTTVLVAGFVALNAMAGSFGLLGGGIDMGPTITGLFPWHSAAVAGISLLAVVGVPMATAVLLALRRDQRWSVASMAAGLVLVGWIVVQVAVIRTFSWMQPASVIAGLVVYAAGRRGRNASDVPVRRGPSPASTRRPRRDA